MLAHELGTVFNQLVWLDMFGNAVQIFGIYNKNSQLIGGFSLYHERRFWLSFYQNPPYTPCAGPFAQINAKNPAGITSEWKKILSLVAEFIEKLNYGVVSFSLSRHIIDTQPFIWQKFKVVPGYTYILDLDKSLDVIYGNMSAERRNDITKARRDGLEVSQVHNMEIVLGLVKKSFLRQNMPVNEIYLHKLLFIYANSSNSFAYAVLKSSAPIAVVFCIHDKNSAYYLLGGYDFEDKHHGAGAMAMISAIEHAKQIGLKQFDFEGSMEPNIERYFRGFGARITPYFRINKALLLLEFVLKFFKREIF